MIGGKFALKTSVPIGRTKAELERVVVDRYGAARFGIVSGEGLAEVVFQTAEPRRGVRFELRIPPRDRGESETTFRQRERSSWRALLLLVKGKLEAVDRGIVEFEQEFLPHLVTDNGETFFQRFEAESLPLISTGNATSRKRLLLPELGDGDEDVVDAEVIE